MKKIKGLFIGMSSFLMTAFSNVYGLSVQFDPKQADLYGPPQLTSPAYIGGIILKFVFLPILIVGIIVIGIKVFLSKKKNKK